MKKMVIWDFDGVIADSERIYLENRQRYFNSKLNLNWDFNTTVDNICGLSDFSNREVLNSLGYITCDDFWDNLVKIDEEVFKKEGLVPTDGIENIIKKLPKQCVATGGIKQRTIVKLELVGFWKKYFNEDNLFTIDMVRKGKPFPDIFLYAAEKMGEKPEDCVVVEDSVAGVIAAQRANMDVIAFLGSKIYQNDNYLNAIKSTGVENICFNMKEVKVCLCNL